MAIFIVELRFVPERNTERLAARPKHREHLTALHERGKLISAGPWADDTGAVQVFDVVDEAELDELLAADPYPPETYETVGKRQWNPLFPIGPSAS